MDKPKGIKYLEFGFYYDSFAKGYKARPHPKAAAKFRAQMKKHTCRSWGESNGYKVEKLNQLIRGWINYFKIGRMQGLCERLDSQIRYRLRMCIWKHWKIRRFSDYAVLIFLTIFPAAGLLCFLNLHLLLTIAGIVKRYGWRKSGMGKGLC